MREFAEERGSANDYIDTVNAWRGNLWGGYKMVLILKMASTYRSLRRFLRRPYGT